MQCIVFMSQRTFIPSLDQHAGSIAHALKRYSYSVLYSATNWDFPYSWAVNAMLDMQSALTPSVWSMKVYTA